MHAVSYKTELLRSINYKQTEGIFYTDIEWMFYPLFFVDKIAFIDANVYQYFLGREGQSVDISVTLKNLSHYLIVINNIHSYYLNFDMNKLPNNHRKYFQNILIEKYTNIYKYYLFYQSYKEFNPNKMEKFDKALKEKDEMIYSNIGRKTVYKAIPFIPYWRKHLKRIPQCVLNMLIKIKKCYEYWI
jgi:hypothetical protein